MPYGGDDPDEVEKSIQREKELRERNEDRTKLGMEAFEQKYGKGSYEA